MPLLVKVISLGAAPKQLATKSLASSSIFFAFLDKACPPDEFANPFCSANLYASNATSLIGLVAA